MRSLWMAVLLGALGACSLWSSKPAGPQPTPLTAIDKPVELRMAWRASTGPSRDAALRAAIAVDAVFAAGADGSLVRWDLGRETWRIKAANRLTAGVAADGERVIVGSADGEVLAFEAATGKVAWKASVAGEPIGAPLIAGGAAIVRVGDNQLVAFALSDGKRRWVYQRAQAPLSLRGHVGMLATGDLVVAGFSGGKLVALSLAGGVPRWEASVAIPRGSNEIERLADVVGDPVSRDDAVCVAAYQGRVACVNATRGTIQWTRDISSAVGVDADARQLVVTDEKGSLHALDMRTGTTLWRQDGLQHRGVGRPLVFPAGIAVTDAEGWLHLLASDDGRFLARIQLDKSGVAAPLLLSGGRILALSRDGAIHAVEVGAAAR